MVDRTRQAEGYRGQPVLFNEDDHFDFDKPDNNMLAAVRRVRGVGVLRLPHEGRGVRRGVPERAGELGDQLGAEAGVLQAAGGGDGGEVITSCPGGTGMYACPWCLVGLHGQGYLPVPPKPMLKSVNRVSTNGGRGRMRTFGRR